jgi:hypothetical protein
MSWLAVWRARVEWKEKVYPRMAALSPTNLYHKVALYVAYGYLAGTTLVADLAGLSLRQEWKWLVLGLVCIVAWLPLVALDNVPAARAKAKFAHTEDWFFGWLVVYYAAKDIVTGR